MRYICLLEPAKSLKRSQIKMKFKKLLSIALSLMMIVSAVPSGAFGLIASAETTTGMTGKCDWIFKDDGTLAIVVTESGGEMGDNLSDDSTIKGLKDKIKTVVVEKGVTSIGKNAFKDFTELTTVTIPNTVTSIGDYAFYGCTKLESIVMLENLKTIGMRAFYNCTKLTDIEMPDSVVSIGYYAFKNTGAYNDPGFWYGKAFYVGDGKVSENIEKPGHLVAYEDETAESVTVLPGTKSIADYTFDKRTALKSINIPESLTAVGKHAFSDCTALTEFNMQNTSLTDIGSYAFKGCTGLTDVVMPDTAVNVGSFAFSGCENLSNLKIGKNVKYIGNSAFSDCIGLEELALPDGIETMEAYAFKGCTGLTEITIPNSLDNINGGVFMGCTGLTKAVIGNSVINIGIDAFKDCTSLEEITLPGSLMRIGEETDEEGNRNYAFTGCPIKTISIAEGATEITNQHIIHEPTLEQVIIPDTVEKIGDKAFAGCTGLTQLNIPEKLTSIGDSAFAGCTGLTQLTIPESTTTIGDGAFAGCTSLEVQLNPNNKSFCMDSKVLYNADKTELIYCAADKYADNFEIPASVTSIRPYAFAGCTELKAVVIPNTITEIPEGAFSGCNFKQTDENGNTIENYGLREVTLSNTITTIADNAFENCEVTKLNVSETSDTLTSVMFICKKTLETITVPKILKSMPVNSLLDCENLKEIKIGDGNAKYRFADGILYTTDTVNELETTEKSRIIYSVPGISGKLEIPAGTTSISGSAFKGRNKLTGVIIPEGVTSIGESAFANCYGEEKDADDKVTATFGIEEVTIPATVTSVGKEAFSGCKLLAEINITGGAKKWGENALKDCPIKVLTLTGNIDSVTSDMIVSKSTVEKIILPDGVKTIGQSAFNGCYMLRDVNIPDTVETIGDSAFRVCVALPQITIPDGVKTIEAYAFYGCTAFTEITVPRSVTSLGEYAFYGCTALTTAKILGNVEIPKNAFSKCINIDNIQLSRTVKNINEYAFEDCSPSLTIMTSKNSAAYNFALANSINLTLMDPEVIKGDVNCDGIISPIDAVEILRNNAEETEFGDFENESGDVDGDHMITAKDAILILRYDAELINKF